MGRYLSHPLSVKCETLADVRSFLITCRAVSDKEQFGKDEYWQPPEDFEKSRRGDCEDFSLWTWREFLAMGYDARFVVGRHGRYRVGHAWVTFKKDGKWYLVEPQFRFVGKTFPRLSTLRYEPKFSVAWDGEKVSFFSHSPTKVTLSPRVLIPVIPEWIWGWSRFLLWAAPRIPRALWRSVVRKTRRNPTRAGSSQSM